jgi:hypothetical protein
MDVKTGTSIRLATATLLPPVGWFVFQQGLAATLRVSCDTAGMPVGTLWGLTSIALCGAAAWLARPSPSLSATERFIARIIQLGAGLFALAIGFQTLATLIVPPCAR